MLEQLDITLFHWINTQLNHPWLDPVMIYITSFRYFQLLLILAILGLFIFGKKYERITVVYLIIGVIFSDTCGGFLKYLFERVRPEHILPNVRLVIESSSSFSFPSNHAANMAAVATVLIARYRNHKSIGIIAIILALLVSYSRIYVGVHFPSDIIFGWVVGIISGVAILYFLNNFDWEKKSDTETLWGVKYLNLLTLILLLITLFRLKYIQGMQLDLTAEEAQYWNWSRHLDWSYYSKGPFIAYIIFLFTKLAGNTVFAIRFGAVSIAVILSYLTYFFAKQMFNSKRIGFYSVLFMNLIPLFSAGAVLMTTDIPLQLFWAGTVYFVYLAISKNKLWSWYLAGLFFGLGLLSKYTIGILIPSLLLFFVFDNHQRVWLKRKEPYLGLLLGLLVFSPVIYWNYTHGWISARHLVGLSKVEQGFNFTILYFLEYLGGQLGIITPWIFAGLAYVWWKTRSPKRKQLGSFPAYFYLWCTSFPIFLIFMLKSIQGKVQANWAAPAYYTGIILAVAFFDRMYEYSQTVKQKRAITIYTWSSMIVTAILILFMHNPEYINKLRIPMQAKYDVTNRLRGWRELGMQTGLVKEEISFEPGNIQVFVFSDSYQVASELAFYLPDQPETYCINLGRRMNQYDIWNGWDKLIGWNAIYVTEQKNKLDDKVAGSFTRYELAKIISINRFNEIIREYYVYKCYNFRGIQFALPQSF